MNMKANKRFLAFAVAAMTAITLSAQSDFGIWTTVSAEKKLSKRWSVGTEAEMRTRDNTQKVSRWSLGFSVEYKITDWLKAGTGYDLIDDNRENYSFHEDGTPNKLAKYWQVKNRFHFDLTGQLSLGNFDFSLRERWQYSVTDSKTVDSRYDFDDDDEDDKPHRYGKRGRNTLRSRLEVSYDIPHCKVTPFVSAEMYNKWNVEKVRYTAGAEWKISKKHRVELYYRFDDQTHENIEDQDMHIVGVGYKFKF